jgi:hypothetical protein
VNLRQRNGWWYARVQIKGRALMFSLRTKDRATAQIAAEQFHETRRARTAASEWELTVSDWEKDSRSWMRRTYRHMRARSLLKRTWESPMSWQQFIGLVRISNGTCAVTGITFELRGSPAAPFSISVDRIDSSRGYAADNCRMVCLMANIAMRHWGTEALFKLCVAYTARVALFSKPTGKR